MWREETGAEERVAKRSYSSVTPSAMTTADWQWIWTEQPVPRHHAPQRQMQLSAECHFLIMALTDQKLHGACECPSLQRLIDFQFLCEVNTFFFTPWNKMQSRVSYHSIVPQWETEKKTFIFCGSHFTSYCLNINFSFVSSSFPHSSVPVFVRPPDSSPPLLSLRRQSHGP